MEKKKDADIEKLPYYHYRVHSIFTEMLLERNGDFLLRDDEMDMANESREIVVRWGAFVKQFPVRKLEDGTVETGGQSASNVSQLINHFVETGSQLKRMNVMDQPSKKSGPRLIRAIGLQPWEILGKATEEDLAADSSQIGRGCFSSVHVIAYRKARTDKFEIVATKMIDGWWDTSDQKRSHSKKLLLQEARTMLQLNGHPNIVGFHGVFVDTEFPAIVTNVVKGCCFQKHLRSQEVTSCWRGLLVGAKDVASAVAYMHQKGYIHRSISSRKFMLTVPEYANQRGRLVLVGLRSARYIGNELIYKSFSSASSMLIRWSALESLTERIWLRESDIWSLGVLLWEMFVPGGVPYKSDGISKSAMIQLLRNGTRLKVPPNVPERIADLTRSCWNADIFKRPSIQTIINVLDAEIASSDCTHAL